MRGFVCVISMRGLSSSYAWSCGSLGIFATFLGFTKCLYKPLFILKVIFIAYRSFHRLEIILQAKGKRNIKKKIAFHFLSLEIVSATGEAFCRGEDFRSPFRSCKMGVWCFEVALVCQRVVSQLRNTLRNGSSAAKFPLSFARSSSNGHNFFGSTPNHIPFEALDS